MHLDISRSLLSCNSTYYPTCPYGTRQGKKASVLQKGRSHCPVTYDSLQVLHHLTISHRLLPLSPSKPTWQPRMFCSTPLPGSHSPYVEGTHCHDLIPNRGLHLRAPGRSSRGVGRYDMVRLVISAVWLWLAACVRRVGVRLESESSLKFAKM